MKESKEIYLTLISTLDEVCADWHFSDGEVSDAFDGLSTQLRAERLAIYYCVHCEARGEVSDIEKLRKGRYTDRVEFVNPTGVFIAAFDRLTGAAITSTPEAVEKYGRLVIGEWLNKWDEILTRKE